MRVHVSENVGGGVGESATAEVQHAELTLWFKQISGFTTNGAN